MKTHPPRIWILLTALLSLSTAMIYGMPAAQGAGHTPDSLDKVRQNMAEEKAVLIDVREKGEWKQGHLREASLLPLSEIRKLSKDPQFATKIAEKVPKDRIIYCHCASGVRTLSAAYFLEKLGYDIRPLAAGYSDLVEAGFPQAKP